MRWIVMAFVFVVLLQSCSKDSFTSAADARLTISADTLKFDTVFATVGSVTQSFKIRNDNNQKLLLSSVRLAGGNSSAYALNINGIATPAATGLELAANDSIYVFVKVTINPNAANLPFVVADSIKIEFNGNSRWVQLQAYGQNARFLRNQKITGTVNWNNQLPYVILGGLTVDTLATLNIARGTRIYCNAGAPIIVHGTLRVTGEKDSVNRVYFRGDRLDPEYKDLPGGWPGIIFTNPSHDNVLNFTVINNAYQALIVTGGAANSQPKLTLNECIVNNSYDIGLFAFASSVNARNCLFSNCGNDAVLGEGGSNIILRGGGNYLFNNATIVTYGSSYQLHKQPVLYVSDGGNPLNAVFRNSIIYGEGGLAEDEIKTDKQGNNFLLRLDTVLYKMKAGDPPNATIVNSIRSQDPAFDTINVSRRIFDFHLRPGSVCINKINGALPYSTDLDGNFRTVGLKTDLGCYEKQ